MNENEKKDRENPFVKRTVKSVVVDNDYALKDANINKQAEKTEENSKDGLNNGCGKENKQEKTEKEDVDADTLGKGGDDLNENSEDKKD